MIKGVYKYGAYPTTEHDPGNSFGIPEELIDVVVSNDLGMVTFPSYELSVNNFIALVSHEAVQRLDDMFQVQALGNWIGSVLTLGTTIVVVGALEDEAHALGHKTDVATLSPAHEKESQLTKTIIVAHVIHGVPPTIQGGIQRFFACGSWATLDTSQSLKARILGLPNGIVKIELSGEVPLAVVRVLATDIISMESEEGLIRRHAGGTRV